MLGVIVNSIAIIAGGIVGLIINKGIPERLNKTIMDGIALVVMYMGISGALKGDNALYVIISICVGGFIGELIDLDKLLEWDDIKLYSEIINIAETHPDSNVRDLATMTIPNMEAFLNMIYSHLDLKNRSKQDLSTQDLRFLQKVKSLIVSNSNLGKNLRNPNFTDENTIFFDEQNSKVVQNQLHSIAPTLKNDTSLINTHLIFQRAYSPDEPIYIRDSDGKIYELSKHPKRKYDWNNISINSHSNFAYIPYLRSCGISENIISKLQNISTGISTYSMSKETYFPQVNMQPLQVGNSLESYFSKLDTSNER